MERLEQLKKWNRPRMVFMWSMSDPFHPDVPRARLKDSFTAMGLNEEHVFQLLTKRPERMVEFAKEHEAGWWPPNVWAGVSVENQEWADKRLPLLAQVPAKVRFVSLEPLLGPVDLSWWLMPHDEHKRPGLKPAIETVTGGSYRMLDWVIFGFESGPNARAGDLQWIRDGLAQCREAGVPAFVKQLGTRWAKEQEEADYKGAVMDYWPYEFWVREWPLRRPE